MKYKSRGKHTVDMDIAQLLEEEPVSRRWADSMAAPALSLVHPLDE